ncbi:hypothetical protein F5B21DRAFT_526727 [Xylaria acuta]|nr:hypothetical protein F5B21DRAFT_526727 [Xylaria acuta]
MIPQAYYRDPPPSYAEATGANLDNRADTTRRHSTTTTTNTSLTPVYSQSGSGSGSGTHIFPPAFCVYCQTTRHYVIGESRYLPLYAVSTHSPLSPKPDLVIYNGVSEDTPPLAFVDHEQPFGRSAGITLLPARQGGRFPASHELLESGGAFSRLMSFDIETAPSGGRREHFEWRHSSGVEVEALGGRHSGWKLLRVSPSPPPPPPPNPTTSTTTKKNNKKERRMRKRSSSSNSTLLGHGGSDGKEVVAVWVATGVFVSRVLRFQFLGSGADGTLGDRWAVMAVASALAIWNRDRRTRNRGLATASF